MLSCLKYQLFVPDLEKGKEWYTKFVNGTPDYNEGIYEWELKKGIYLQLMEGKLINEVDILRIRTENFEEEILRLNKVGINEVEIEEGHRDFNLVTVRDPWGNKIGFYEYQNNSIGLIYNDVIVEKNY